MAAQRLYDDPLTEEILQAVPLEVRRTFTPDQRLAIQNAVRGFGVVRKHRIDIRFVVPLFFTQLYVVFLVGRDRRRETEQVLLDRRSSMGRAGLASIAAVIGVLVLVGGLIGLYWAKSRAGIDLMPNAHAKDLLR